jgi:hypothetical protein
MSDPRVEAFLAAEQQAVALVDELESLKKEIGSYRNARDVLNAAGGHLEDAAGRLADLTSQAGAVLEAIRRIGTPELIASIERVEHVVSAGFRSASTSQQAGQSALTGAISRSTEQTVSAVRRVQTAVIICTVLIVLSLLVVRLTP